MRVFSGIQPTGDIHIGNYLGAIKQWKKLQEYDNFSRLFFIVDYHSLTANPVSAKEKRNQIEQLAVDLLAVGLDPEKSILAIQSHIPEVLELAWIFNCLTPMGELERMTQFKDKAGLSERDLEKSLSEKSLKKRLKEIFDSERYKEEKEYSLEESREILNLLSKLIGQNKVISVHKGDANTGLFTYPILQAADILLYQAEMVPVGEDQLQHLELARETARRFNRRYGEFFKEPKQRISRVPKLMSLNNPLKKMSKSDPNSYIGIFDEPDDIRKKIRSAVSADNNIIEFIKYIENIKKNNEELLNKIGSEGLSIKIKKEYEGIEEFEIMRAGVINLLNLLAEFNQDEFKKLIDSNGNIDLEKLKYGEIKNILAESIIDYFAPMREKRNELMRDKQAVMRIYDEGAEKARVIAQETMRDVRKSVGLS